MLIIDKTSMVSNDLLLHAHCRLVEILGSRTDVSFAGITIIAVGDFYVQSEQDQFMQNIKMTS